MMDQSNQHDSWAKENWLQIIQIINNLTATTTPANAVKTTMYHLQRLLSHNLPIMLDSLAPR